MDGQTLLAAREFAAYDFLFEHILQKDDSEGTKNSATPGERVPPDIVGEEFLALHPLLAEAVVRSELQEADVRRLLSFEESVIGEMVSLLRRLAGK